MAVRENIPVRLSIAVTIWTILFTQASLVAGRERHSRQECDCGPQISFLDDLFCGLSTASDRDPYEERIETERHDFTQSTKTVGGGAAQIKAGYSYFYKDEDEEIEQSHATPEMLLRLGLSDDIEFRLRWNYTWRFIDEANNADSAQDLNWSFKLEITDHRCWTPESALQIRGTAPTGGTDWTTGRVEFGLDYHLCLGTERRTDPLRFERLGHQRTR